MSTEAIRSAVERGDEHLARERFGDEAVDQFFRADGVDPDAARRHETAGPYIITTIRELPSAEDHSSLPVEEHWAVATLDQARANAAHQVDRLALSVVAYRAAYSLPESGGTIGPLSDGTVIEVRAVTYDDLIAGAPDVDWFPIINGPTLDRRPRIIDAYNERECQHG